MISMVEFSGVKKYVRLDISERTCLYIYFCPDTFICKIKDANIEEIAEKICKYIDGNIYGKNKVIKWLKELLIEQFND